VLELSDGITPRAAFGPFDNEKIANAFAIAVRLVPQHDVPTVVLELNKEPIA
jgi:hypothetical protein